MHSSDIALGSMFVARRGESRYTRDYALSHPGTYPVYSASLSGPLSHIDSYDYNGRYLSFTTNGYAGTVQVLEGKFSLNADRALLLPIEGVATPDLHYLRHAVESAIRPLGVGRRVDGKRNEYTKLSPETATDALVTVLVDQSGSLDLDAMERVGLTLRRADDLQRNLSARADAINASSVVIECEEPYRTTNLSDPDLFHLSIGSRVLKVDVKDAGIPVYSANVRKPFGFVSESTLTDITHDSLIWGIDGVFDWNLVPKGQDFVPTDHCGRLEVLDSTVDATYLLHELRSTRLEYGFDRVFRASLHNIEQVQIRIPVTADGAFDLKRQCAMACRYEAIDRLRESTVSALNTITSVNVVPEAQ